jgi:formamidopyrimidine-DNA glycosylase
MPELPEVENTRRYLIKAGLPSRRFKRVNIGWSKSVKHPSLEDFVLGVTGKRVESVQRRGKYILLSLDTQETLIFHLGMTGGLRIHPKSLPAPPLVRHTLALDDGRELRFVDPRKFGHLWLADDPGKVVGSLGPEPLDDSFTPEALAQALGRRSVPIKALLLEQSAIAGLGNLYADESLFLAGIYPERLASDLSSEEVGHLRDAIVRALSYAVAEYDQARKTAWPDPPFALSPWTIPRRIGGPCPKCGGIVEMIRVRGRTTYYCPECQPPSR